MKVRLTADGSQVRCCRAEALPGRGHAQPCGRRAESTSLRPGKPSTQPRPQPEEVEASREFVPRRNIRLCLEPAGREARKMRAPARVPASRAEREGRGGQCPGPDSAQRAAEPTASAESDEDKAGFSSDHL